MYLVAPLFSISLLSWEGPQSTVSRPHPSGKANPCLTLDLLNQGLRAGPEVRVLTARRTLGGASLKSLLLQESLLLASTASSAITEALGLHGHSPVPGWPCQGPALHSSSEGSLLGSHSVSTSPEGISLAGSSGQAPPRSEGQLLCYLVPIAGLSSQGWYEGSSDEYTQSPLHKVEAREVMILSFYLKQRPIPRAILIARRMFNARHKCWVFPRKIS